VTPPPGPAQHATPANGQAADAVLRELDGTTFIVIDFEALTPAGRTAGMLSGARPACEVMADLERQLMVPGRCRLVAQRADRGGPARRAA